MSGVGNGQYSARAEICNYFGHSARPRRKAEQAAFCARPRRARLTRSLKRFILPFIAGAGRYLLNEIRMCANESENTGLEALEARVEELIDMLERLKSENSALRTERESLLQERAMLTEKTEQARRRIESIISRLSALEIRS